MLRVYNQTYMFSYPGEASIITEFGDTKLHKLVRAGDVSALSKYLVENPDNVNQCDDNHEESIPPLFLACLTNNTATAEILVAHGAQVNMSGKGINDSGKYYSVTPLHVAVYHDSYDMVGFLVKKGADVNARMLPSGYTALHLAITYKRLKIATFLLGQCDADPNIPGYEDYCNYPIMKALLMRDVRMLLLLLCNRKLDINVCDAIDGMTALHLAVLQASLEATKMILCRPADPNPKLTSGHTPLDLAYLVYCEHIKNKTDIISILETTGGTRNVESGYLPIVYYLKDTNVEILQNAVESGAKVNCRVFNGVTFLHHAVQKKEWLTIRLLLNSGADVHAIDDFGCTPLHYAASNDDAVAIHLLIKKGADVNAVDFSGRTPLHRAADSGATTSCCFLVKSGAEIGVNSFRHGTPVFCAIMSSVAETVGSLLDLGEDPNACFTFERIKSFSPLHAACSFNFVEIMEKLIAKGANVNAPAFSNKGLIYPLDLIRFSADDSGKALTVMLEAGAYFDVDTIPKMRGKDLLPPDTPVPTLEQVIIASGNGKPHDIYRKTVMLFSAVRKNDFEAVKKQVSEGAVINCCSVTYDTPLIFASYSGSLPIVDLLLKEGAKMYMPGVKRSSPLHYAAKYDRRDVAVRLLKSGARVTYLCNDKTAIELAMEKGHIEMVNLLVFVGKYLLEIQRKTIFPVKKYKCDPVISKVLAEMNGRRPARKLLYDLFSR